MGKLRLYLGLDGENTGTPTEQVLPIVMVGSISLLIYGSLDKPWWQEILIVTAAIAVVGIVAGVWASRTARAS